MTSWRVAPAVLALFKQADLQAPKRDDDADGTIGDTSHAARKSDHNPDAQGWVYAGDLTDDDASGIDCREIARQIVERRDRRVKYLIHEGRMVSSYATSRYPAWTWRPYSGVNGHFKHLHVSVLPTWRNDTSPWWAPPATPDEEDDELTPDEKKMLKEVHEMLKAIGAPRRSDRADVDPMRISLADAYTLLEKTYTEARKAAAK